MLTYEKKPGNAGCTKCGLRASSKNVQIRSVFPIWPREETGYACQVFETGIRIKDVEWDIGPEDVTITMTAVNPRITNKETGEHPTLGKFINDMIRFGLNGDEIEAVLCDHQWKQDPGTNTV